MNLRRKFWSWLFSTLPDETITAIDERFFDLIKEEYAFEQLDNLIQILPKHDDLILDYKNIEHGRYGILRNKKPDIGQYVERARQAQAFCSSKPEEKKRYRFLVHPSLEAYLISSQYSWFSGPDLPIRRQTSHGLIIPSPLIENSTKEVPLYGFDAVLLDILTYPEVFSYSDFFDLLDETLQISATELEKKLLHFLSVHSLYYQTIIIC